MKKLAHIWKTISTPIYTGKRLQTALTTLTTISLFTAVMGLALVILDIVIKQYEMLIPACLTLLGGASCAFVAGVLKKREIAIIIPTVFCAVMFTIYTVTGAADGTAILWSLFLPIGICYFVSVKYGILLSIYYSILFIVMFYSPLRNTVSAYYSDAFMLRFPLVYISMAAFTAIAMVAYHRGVLLENEYADRLSREVEKQTHIANERADRLESFNEEMIQTLAQVIDAKDKYTNGHSFRVSTYAVALADHLGWDEQRKKDLRLEALLHDIGKIGVPDSVLNKPGRLTPEEYRIIQSHTDTGGDILKASSALLGAAETARYHHERYDGTGYPSGIKGTQIPLNARVVSIADAYDAMHTDRPYRTGLPYERIRQELTNGRGTQFDPELLDTFLKMLESGELAALDKAG